MDRVRGLVMPWTWVCLYTSHDPTKKKMNKPGTAYMKKKIK